MPKTQHSALFLPLNGCDTYQLKRNCKVKPLALYRYSNTYDIKN